MKLTFPNPSRSFDPARNCVCFWGYDRAIEVSFYLDVDALVKLHPGMNEAEAGCLQAFDSSAQRIHKVASKVHIRRGGESYAHSLSANDF